MFLGGTCQEYYLASAWVERMHDVRLDASDIKMRSLNTPPPMNALMMLHDEPLLCVTSFAWRDETLYVTLPR